mmetsp:Transcript_21888/g.75282  ORF Transcript_21888/g.75282 Transcript_21888/m.75282 type:complete len:263 (-) Transcript_21888:553-1341(-)
MYKSAKTAAVRMWPSRVPRATFSPTTQPRRSLLCVSRPTRRPRRSMYISQMLRPNGTTFLCSGSTSKSEGWELSLLCSSRCVSITDLLAPSAPTSPPTVKAAASLPCRDDFRWLRCLVPLRWTPCSSDSSSTLRGESGTSLPASNCSSVHPVSRRMSWSLGVIILVGFVSAQPPCFLRTKCGSSYSFTLSHRMSRASPIASSPSSITSFTGRWATRRARTSSSYWFSKNCEFNKKACKCGPSKNTRDTPFLPHLASSNASSM